MGYNEFYLNTKESSRYLDLNQGKSLINSMFRFSLKYFKSSSEYKVIHVHSNQLLLVCWLIDLIKLKKNRFIYTVHTSFENLKGKNKILFFINIYLAKRVVFCSQASFDSFPISVKSNEKCLVIRNGVNIQHSNLSNSFLGFICLGRLINLKRVDGVMRAYSNSGVSAGLKFIGDGVLYRELEDMSRSLLNVIMLGKVERNTVLEELQKAKSIVSFSSIEGMPVSILEGISKRCVPILSKIPPHEELVSLGFKVYIAENEEELAKNICQVDSLSSEECNRIVDYNYNLLVKECTIESMLALYNKQYKVDFDAG
ncbi:Putative uncharacterized protein [Vibrio anguillarum]|nr:glycosyl transferases group 1 family protein [Vibrio anguillarum]CDQ51401.1 Putative uncharacterized protein [Vibrio anguillarum]